MLKKLVLVCSLGTMAVLAGCGSSGGGSGSSSSNSGSAGITKVAGPLNPVQNTLNSSVFTPLENATAKTPLKGVLVCTNKAVNGNLLDAVNALLNGVQNPSALASTTPAEVQAQIQQLVQNLGGLLSALAGKGSCDGASNGIPNGNPLAGTPLSPLGSILLPVLQQLQGQLANGSSGPKGFASLAALVSQLNTTFQMGLSQLPSQATTAPILGGALTTVQTSLSDLTSLLNAMASNNASQLNSAVQATLNNALMDVLTKIVPVAYLENQAGKPGVLTGPIQQATNTLTSSLGTALSSGTPALTQVLGSSQLAPVLNPVLNQLLPAIINPITQGLAAVGTSGAAGGGSLGQTLDSVLAPLSTTLNSLLGGTSLKCVFVNIPALSSLCQAIP